MTNLFKNDLNEVVRKKDLLILKLIIAWLVIAVVILLKVNYGLIEEIMYIKSHLFNPDNIAYKLLGG